MPTLAVHIISIREQNRTVKFNQMKKTLFVGLLISLFTIGCTQNEEVLELRKQLEAERQRAIVESQKAVEAMEIAKENEMQLRIQLEKCSSENDSLKLLLNKK